LPKIIDLRCPLVAVGDDVITAQHTEKRRLRRDPQTRNLCRRARQLGNFRDSGVERLLTTFAFAVAALLIVAFGLDLVTGWPFWRASKFLDVSFVACGFGLAYLSWNAHKTL
jgi:hypothetical protein